MSNTVDAALEVEDRPQETGTGTETLEVKQTETVRFLEKIRDGGRHLCVLNGPGEQVCWMAHEMLIQGAIKRNVHLPSEAVLVA